MTTPEIILQEARRLGLQLERRGENLVVRPRNRITSDFRAAVRAHKDELLGLLTIQLDHTSNDFVSWLHIAKQVLAGEFVGADGSTRESLANGLRSVRHPACVAALKQIGATKDA